MPAHDYFHYHASGHAFSGELIRPVQRIIPVQAGITLPTTGGVGAAHVENFRLDEVVSFRRGSAHVSGSIKEDKEDKDKIIHTTHATATIEGLNILDIVTADRIVAHLSSSHKEGTKAREGEVLLVGSRFENLRFAGCPVDVELHHRLFLELKTHEAIKRAWERRGSELRTLADETAKTITGKEAPDSLELYDPLLCSIVKKVHFKESGFGECPEEDKEAEKKKEEQRKKEKEYKKEYPCPGVKRLGHHAYHIVDFGNVFLGEVLCQHGRKTLTMLRVELGSPNGGGFIAVQADSNGLPPYGH